MLGRLLLSFGLMALCVVLHAIGSMALLRRLGRAPPPAGGRFWPSTWLLVRVAAVLVLLHVAEIAAWGWGYAQAGALPGCAAAIYFSAVTYTTVGYGDLVLPDAWRLVGAVEALTGILMCGWSTGLFFAVVSRTAAGWKVGPGAGR